MLLVEKQLLLLRMHSGNVPRNSFFVDLYSKPETVFKIHSDIVLSWVNSYAKHMLPVKDIW